MKIIYFADGPWAHNAFDQILAAGDFTIAKVLLRYNSSDEILRSKAEGAGIEVLCPKNVNENQFIEMLKDTGADLGVSMSYNQIIKKDLMDIFPGGIINCHAGKLPEYRGRNVLNWALINGEKEIGVTCHYIDEGIDTGDIIVQKTFPVTMKDDYGTVLDKAFKLCSEVLVDAMQMIRQDQVDPQPQPKAGSYFIERKDGDEFIDWNWSSLRIFNFVRAITDPGPYARTWLQIHDTYCLVIVKQVQLIEDAFSYNCIPGGVVGRSNEGLPIVKTGDTLLLMTDFEIQDPNKTKMKIGDRLGINKDLRIINAYREGRL